MCEAMHERRLTDAERLVGFVEGSEETERASNFVDEYVRAMMDTERA